MFPLSQAAQAITPMILTAVLLTATTVALAAVAGAWMWLRRRRQILESRDFTDVLQSIPDDDSKPNATTG